jgi:hypothetical protein
MSERKRSDDDLADAPFIDEAERAESNWLLARETDHDARPPSSKIASDYAELEDLLGSLPPGLPDEHWHDEVLRIASSSASPSRVWWRRSAFRWAIGGAFVTASAAAVWLLMPRAPAELEVAIHHVDPTRGDEVAVRDHLIVTARPLESADLRVYRSDGKLVGSCSSGQSCSASAKREYTIEVSLDAPGRYYVILVVGPLDAPLSGTMDAYLGAAHAANARIVTYKPIDVH